MRTLLLTIFGLTFFMSAANADVMTEDMNVHFGKAYAYQTAPSQKNGAVFVKIKNDTDKEIKITAAHSDVAQMVELHTHSMEDGHMSMYPVDFFMLPAEETHELKPSGDHVMLMMLKQPLKVGENFQVTFDLDNGETHTVDVHVMALGQ